MMYHDSHDGDCCTDAPLGPWTSNEDSSGWVVAYLLLALGALAVVAWGIL